MLAIRCGTQELILDRHLSPERISTDVTFGDVVALRNWCNGIIGKSRGQEDDTTTLGSPMDRIRGLEANMTQYDVLGIEQRLERRVDSRLGALASRDDKHAECLSRLESRVTALEAGGNNIVIRGPLLDEVAKGIAKRLSAELEMKGIAGNVEKKESNEGQESGHKCACEAGDG